MQNEGTLAPGRFGLLPLLVVLVALLACGAPNTAPQSPRHTSSGTPQAQAGAPRCSNDYACAAGEQCVKDSLAFEGVCAQTVNANGIPEYRPPRSNSIGPGTGNCSFDMECAIGFRCVKTSGGLYGNCMK